MRGWVRRAEVDAAGKRSGVTSSEHEELKRANEILRTASVFPTAAE